MPIARSGIGHGRHVWTPQNTALQDYLARSSGAFFAENFSYASLAEAQSHTTNPKFYGASAGSNGAIYQIRDDNALSGRSLRINYPPNSGGSGYSWLQTFDDNNGVGVAFPGVPHDNFYFQVILWADRHWDFPFKMDDGQNAEPKALIIDRHDSSSNAGEVVLVNSRGRCLVEAYIGATPTHGYTLMDKALVTPNGAGLNPDYQKHSRVDNGGPLVTMADYWARYGGFHSDNPVIPFGDVTGTSSLETDYGRPRPEHAASTIVWQRGYWTVVEFHINGAGNLVRYWAARYGNPPKLLGDTTHMTGLDMGRGTDGYPGFQFTPYITDNGNAAGASQPTTYIDYVEAIARDTPIPFPRQLGVALPT